MGTRPTFRYLDVRPSGPIGGRGNATRLFMLANKISFREELQPMDSWMNGEKERYIKEGLNPLGHLPVLEYDGKCIPESISIARFMARSNGLYGKDAQLDFETDAAADAHQEWRNAWAKGIFGTDDDKKEYDGNRKFYLDAMENYYKRRSAQDSVYLAGGDVPGFADTAIFNMIRDDNVTMGDAIPLDSHPNLKAMYEKLDDVPEVRKWIEDWEARNPDA